MRTQQSSEPASAGLSACLILCLLAVLGCGAGSESGADAGGESAVATPPAAAAAPQLEVLEPRAQLMPGMGAVYLRVVNSGALGDRLVAIETPIAETVETHESVEEDGVMRMVAHPQGFEIPPGGSLDLVPGGKHAMLIDPQPSADTTTVPLTLHFATSASLEVEAEIMAMDSMAHGGSDHGGSDHGGHGGSDHGGSDHGEMGQP